MSAKKAKQALTMAITSNSELKKCHDYTLQDKLIILDYCKEFPSATETAVALHFQQNGYPKVSQPVVNRIKKSKDSLQEQALQKGNLGRKWPPFVEHPKVEKALSIWVLQVQAKRIRLTGEVLRARAHKFAELQGIKVEDFLILSNGWLEKFKEQHNLREY